jgi:hypothetical protein
VRGRGYRGSDGHGTVLLGDGRVWRWRSSAALVWMEEERGPGLKTRVTGRGL